jgi:hypothetical protein
MSLTLVIEEDFCFRECIHCGDEIPDPYLEDDDDERNVLCSTCDAERGHRYWLKRKFPKKPAGLGEAICECGKRLTDCTIATCHQPDPPPRHRAKLAVREPQEQQRKLFD